MSEGELELVYNMCKNFVDKYDKNQELKGIIFEIDGSPICDVGKIRSDECDLIDMMQYAEMMSIEALNIKKFFCQMLYQDMICILDNTKEDAIFTE